MPRTIPPVELVDVTASELKLLSIGPTSTGEISISVTYAVLDDQGEEYSDGVYSAVLSGPILTDIVQWLTNRVIPRINEQEGM